ncbi:hypothetical protein Tco_1069354 [Tanacetum coccineum]|uniref:Uncharacterized protein n=1 Tax=Tanacetum coccineum TaxID=301880 RepID=A0ABQ5HK88_9ASTR
MFDFDVVVPGEPFADVDPFASEMSFIKHSKKDDALDLTRKKYVFVDETSEEDSDDPYALVDDIFHYDNNAFTQGWMSPRMRKVKTLMVSLAKWAWVAAGAMTYIISRN